MSVLIIAEHDNNILKSSTLNTISAALKLSEDIHLLILGSKIENLCKNTQSIHKVSKILKCDNEKLENFIPEIMAPIVSNIAKNYTYVLAPASTFGKNLLPRVSALLDVTQISDVIEILSENTFVRPIYAGNAISQVETNQNINLLTIRPTAFDKCEESGGSASIEDIEFLDTDTPTLFVGREVSKSDRPDLGNARVVVCGAISQYNSTSIVGPKNYLSLLVNRAQMIGMVVFDYKERYQHAYEEIIGWIESGKLKSKEDIYFGLDNFYNVFQKLFNGNKQGKLILKV